MSHIGDGNKMVSDTPRTDWQLDVSRKFGCYQPWIAPSFARQLERELARCNNLYRKLDVHSLGLCDIIRKLESELQEANERIRLLIAERDTARMQADQNWKLREEFTALLGTDDVKEAVRKLKRWKAQKISTTQTK